jgi:hypothetical protein
MKGWLVAWCLLLGIQKLGAGNFDGRSWCDGPVHLQVDTSGAGDRGDDPDVLAQGILQAAARWNEALKLPLFQAEKSAPGAGNRSGDGVSGIYFSVTISPTQAFGSQFGFSATDRSSDGRLGETDLILNPAHAWFFYHGPLRYDADGNRIPDVYRVVLHEMGHLLGLAHPPSDDELTIMRSRMSDVDDLTALDLADAKDVAALLLEKNAPRFRGYGGAAASTSSRGYRFHGTGNPFFVPGMLVKISSSKGERRRYVRIGRTWSWRVGLQPGLNRFRFYYRGAGARPVRFATRSVTAR